MIERNNIRSYITYRGVYIKGDRSSIPSTGINVQNQISNTPSVISLTNRYKNRGNLTTGNTYRLIIQDVPLATELGISLIILKITQRNLNMSTFFLSHFLHNDVSPLQISLQYPY